MPNTIAGLSLRAVLRFDAALCIVMGLALIALRNVLAGPTALPTGFLMGAGALLLPVGAFILAVAAPGNPPRAGVVAVVLGNVLWIAASIAVLALGLVPSNAFGTTLILLQAAGVAAIAFVEGRLSRDSAPTQA